MNLAATPAPSAAPRVRVLYHYFWPDDVVSAMHYAQLCQGLVERGWQVEAIASNRGCRDEGSVYPRTETHEGVLIRRIWRPPARQASVPGRLLNAAWMIAAWGALALEPARTQPDVLIVGTDPILSGLVSIPYARLRPHVRTVHWCFDLYPESAVAEGLLREGSLAHRAITALMGAAYRSFDVIADLGLCMRERLDRYGHGAARVTLPPWALRESPPAADAVAAARTRLFGDARLGILYSGNFGRAHTYEAFLALARELRDADVRFVFSVRGNRAEELRRALESSPNVELVPFATDREAPAQLAAADIHLASLKPEWTGLAVPSKFTGSLAAGRPFIFAGSPRSALADVIQRHGVGWVLDDSNIVRTAAVLRELAQDREQLALIQERCRTTYAREFSHASVLDRWNDELRRLLEIPRGILRSR